MAALPPWPYPKRAAHRGAGKLAPENTLAALRLGHAHGYRMAEFDVNLSADGVAFLLHDATLDRTTDGTGRADALTWRELSLLDAGSWHSASYAGESLPTLAAVARYCRANGIVVNIEIKPTPGRERETGAAVALDAATFWKGSDVPPLLSSFSATALEAALEVVPSLPRAWLTELGFMTDLARDDMLDGVADLLERKFVSEQLFLLEARVRRGETAVFQTRALNDVVVNKGDVGRMIEFAVSIDGEFIYNQRSDGLIIATPTGATAYALSANGSILHPAVPGNALVPLCPHALSNRPITVSDGSGIEIVLHAPHRARVHADGQEKFDIEAGDHVSVARSARSIRFLHPLGYSYFAMLREKLHWSETPRRY